MNDDNGKYQSLAAEVEERYGSEFVGKFPYKDCYAIQKMYPKQAASLIPDLDEYFSFIAGYSSSASRLSARSGEELRNAIPKLKRSFFEKHPEYRPLEGAIAQTTMLSRKMKVADEVREKLITIMERLG